MKTTFEKLLDKEMESISYLPARKWVKEHLVKPWQKTLLWEYGNQEPFQAWVFANFQERNVVAAYCSDGGFGALGSPWGIIFSNDDYFGMDAGWYSTLESLIMDGWVDTPKGWSVP